MSGLNAAIQETKGEYIGSPPLRHTAKRGRCFLLSCKQNSTQEKKMLKHILIALLFSCLLVVPAFGKPIIDNDGKVVQPSKPFERIISLYGAHTRNLIDMGAGSQIVAIGRSDKQLSDLPKLSFRDDPERLLALQPDLVLIRPMLSRSYPKMVERLEANGVT
ncbi:MAG: hypothetical protein D3910_25390, partial [Candidatus Electrothrix sp. ATG2]|nr:hypothetical protein [Candidatus Electrothrix sp. ATG2]